MRDSGAIDPTFDQAKKIITKDLEDLNSNILENVMSQTSYPIILLAICSTIVKTKNTETFSYRRKIGSTLQIDGNSNTFL